MTEKQAVSLLAGTALSERDVAMRESLRRYVFNETDPQHHGLMRHLWERWEKWNEEFFDGLMTVPIILINEPSNPRRLGDCGPVSGFGCSSQIRIRPSLLVGTHPSMRGGSGDLEGRRRFVEDILIHEMLHQWGQEVTGKRDKHYSGHGPAFAAKANEISRKWELPEVGKSCKVRDRKNGEPEPQYWPSHVRPEGYYLGAVTEKTSCVSISKDELTVEERLLGEVQRLVDRHGTEAVYTALRSAAP